MRRTVTCAMTVALAAGLLVGCSAGPNEQAVAAATSYSNELAEWSQELSTAAESARTATTAERRAAGEGELGFTEVGLGDVLASAPTLKQFTAGEVENTPRYRIAARAAAQVDAIVDELAGFEPKALDTLRQASDDSYWVVADLYYDTLSGPSTDRLAAQNEALKNTGDFATFNKILRTSSLSFAKARLKLLGVAATDMAGTAKDADRPVIPEKGLGVSVGAFIVDWLHEEEAVQKDVIEEIGSWKTLGAQADSFLNFGNVNGTFTAPEKHAAALRTAFVTQVGDIASVLSETKNSAGSAKLPALGDPYRQALIDGYLPWGDAAESPEHTVDRLWMLWHIRELEKTPDAAYTSARVALLEELNRSIAEGAALDVRPGSGRLVSFVRVNALTLVFSPDATANAQVVAAMEELLGYGEMLRSYPMTPEVSAGFDEVMELYTRMAEEMTAVIESTPDEIEQWGALADLEKEYRPKVLDAAASALETLEDDAGAQPLTEAAIEATAPR